MDGHRFDALTRALAAGHSRRRFVAWAVGGLLGLATHRADAQSCREAGRLCSQNGNCCSGLCDPATHQCACPQGTVNCRGACKASADFQADPNNCGSCGHRCPRTLCRVGTCSGGVCGLAADPAAVGRACDDGNPCTIDDTCTATGHCVGSPVVCPAQDDCHQATCDRATGQCRQTPLTDTPCDDGTACTTNDTCQDGTCVGGPALVCPSGQICDALLGCVCSTNDGCPAGHECFHGGCFLLNPSDTSQFCFDHCGPSNIAILGGNFVCVGAVGTSCASDAGCPVGQACFANSLCVAPC